MAGAVGNVAQVSKLLPEGTENLKGVWSCARVPRYPLVATSRPLLSVLMCALLVSLGTHLWPLPALSSGGAAGPGWRPLPLCPLQHLRPRQGRFPLQRRPR
eukprot:1030208-Prorocentrum_minimum.AAC.1